jgi:hypothetical protein
MLTDFHRTANRVSADENEVDVPGVKEQQLSNAASILRFSYRNGCVTNRATSRIVRTEVQQVVAAATTESIRLGISSSLLCHHSHSRFNAKARLISTIFKVIGCPYTDFHHWISEAYRKKSIDRERHHNARSLQ